MPSFATRLSVFYAALFAWAGMAQPLFPVWLKAKGLDPDTIGLVLALPMLVRVLTIPPAARAADRNDALRAALIIAAGLATLGLALVALAEGARAIAAAYGVAAIFFGLLMPFADAFALKGLGRLRRSLGPVRMWGSAAFIAGSFAAGVLIDWVTPRLAIWGLVAAMALAAVCATRLGPLPPDDGAGGDAPKPAARQLLTNPVFIAIVLSASLTQSSHSLYYGFAAIDWRMAGYDGTTIGVLWAIGIVIEIILFALQSRLPPWLGPTEFLLIGAVAGVLRWGGMALDPPPALLPVLQALHALTFGATFLGTVDGIARVATPALAATGQGWFALVVGPVTAGATIAAGWLYQRYGDHAYAAMAAMSAAGGLVALSIYRWQGRAAAAP